MESLSTEITRQHQVGELPVQCAWSCAKWSSLLFTSSHATCTSENCNTSIAYISGKNLYFPSIFCKNIVNLYFKFTVGGFYLVFAWPLHVQYSQCFFIIVWKINLFKDIETRTTANTVSFSLLSIFSSISLQ